MVFCRYRQILYPDIALALQHVLNRIAAPLALILILCGTVLAYEPGLHGPFVFDDLHNIHDNGAIAVQHLDWAALKNAAFSRNSGLSARALSMVSFALNYYAVGFDPFAYKLTNVVIHLLIGLCLVVLTRQILTSYQARHQPLLSDLAVRLLSVTVAAAWLVHPLNLSSVLYVVQRMNALAALSSCLGLMFYLWGRPRLGRGGYAGALAMIAGLAVFTPLGILAKENGALLPLYAFVIELCLFRFRPGPGGGRGFVIALFTVFLAVPLAAFLAYVAIHPGWLLNGYINRDFDLPQRLLTEARAVWLYLSLIAVPDITRMGLYHDDFAISRGLLTPWTTLPAVLGLAGLLALAAWCYRRAPLAAMGILFYLGGLSMESTIIPLEPVFEHRNYLPMYGLLLPALYYLTHPALRQGRPARLRWAAIVGAVAVLAFATTLRAHQWGDTLLFGRTEVAHHPQSPRANYELGRVYYTRFQHGSPPRRRDFMAARRYFARATLASPTFINGLFGMIPLYELAGRPMPPQLLDMLADRLAHAPFSNNGGNMLTILVSCQERDECGVSTRQVHRLLQAALQNKTLAGRNEASVYTSVSRILALSDDFEGALQAARRAAAADPGELQYRLNVIHWMISAGHLDEARQALDRYQGETLVSRYADYLRDEAKRLKDAELLQRIVH